MLSAHGSGSFERMMKRERGAGKFQRKANIAEREATNHEDTSTKAIQTAEVNAGGWVEKLGSSASPDDKMLMQR